MADPRFVGRFEWERDVRHIPMRSATKFVILLAATYANRDGTNVRPGNAQLVSTTGMSDKTVRDALKDAREIGVLFRVSKGSNSGRAALTDVYRLSLPQ